MKMITMKMRTSRYKAAFDAMLYVANVKEIFYENLKNVPIESNLTIGQFFLKTAPHRWVKKSFKWLEAPVRSRMGWDAHSYWGFLNTRWTTIEQKLKKREIKNDT